MGNEEIFGTLLKARVEADRLVLERDAAIEVCKSAVEQVEKTTQDYNAIALELEQTQRELAVYKAVVRLCVGIEKLREAAHD